MVCAEMRAERHELIKRSENARNACEALIRPGSAECVTLLRKRKKTCRDRVRIAFVHSEIEPLRAEAMKSDAEIIVIAEASEARFMRGGR